MTNLNSKIIQVSLVILGIVLIVGTYYLYPQKKLKNLEKSETTISEKKDENKKMEKQTSSFTNVEYTGFDGASNPFKLTAKNADTLIDQPNIIRMRVVKCWFYFKDNKIMIITSNRGTFNKITNDMTFVDSVKMDYDNSLLTGNNLDVLITENAVIMYDNVLFYDEEATLAADKIYFDVIKETIKISMNTNDEKIKMKLIK